MKRIIRGLSAVALSAALLVAGGCGEDSATSQGQVVKGPVKGATVTGAKGATAVTDANGKYPLFGGPYVSTGGTYRDLATGAELQAPALRAPVGANNITPITTLINDNPEVKEEIESLGIKFDDALTTATAGNKDAIALNEAVGGVLSTLKSKGGNDTESKSFIGKLATEIKSKGKANGEVATAEIGNRVKNAVTATPFTTAAVIAAVETIKAEITKTCNEVEAIKPGEDLPGVDDKPRITGTTGGNSAGTSAQ
ncbi:MAG: hypothetical protein H7Y05_01995 [Steroidobacteraceae bacterium]|nr:hypothetical protein [Deltaproteobacteria bacterium]